MSGGVKIPAVKWAQRPHSVFVTIEVADSADAIVELTEAGKLVFGCNATVGGERVEYKLDVELSGAVDVAACKKHSNSRRLFLSLKKKGGNGKSWKSLVKGAKPRWLKADFDKWVDEDDSDDSDDGGGSKKALPDDYFMPGMTDMEGAPVAEPKVHGDGSDADSEDEVEPIDEEDMSDPANQMRIHHQAFQVVVKKYGLDAPDKADKLSAFLTFTGHDGGTITPPMVAKEFGMHEEDAKTFLSWVQQGVKFKEENLDGTKEKLAALNM